MRKFLYLLTVVLALCVNNSTAVANETINGKTITITSSKGSDSNKETGFTCEYNGKTYPVYITKNGRCYIMVVSQKSGNPYRKQLSEETSRKICAALGRTYVEKVDQ